MINLDKEKLAQKKDTVFRYNIAMDKEDILEKFEKLSQELKELQIVGQSEDDDYIYLHLANGNTIITLKPRDKSQIEIALMYGKFPTKLIRQIWYPKPTFCINLAKKAIKPLCLCGPAGIGKTYACIWKIAELLKFRQINHPLYVPLQEIMNDEPKIFKKHDCYLLDDVNANLPPWKIEIIRSIIYHAYNNNKPCFITSNLDKKELFKLLHEEPIISRVLEMCEIYEVMDRDLRQNENHYA